MEREKKLALVRQAIQGDKKAVEELCRQETRSIIYLCAKTLGNLQDAEDASQEVLIQMSRDIGALKSAEAYGVWLQKMAMHVCYKQRRREMNNNYTLPIEDYTGVLEEEDVELLPAEYFEQKDKKQQLLDTVHELPEGMRACILLYYFNGLSASEVADALDMTENAVKVQLHRARCRLKTELGNKRGDVPVKTQGTLPMSCLSALLEEEARAVVPQALVNRCLAAAGLSKAALPSALLGLQGALAGLPGVLVAVGIAGITLASAILAVIFLPGEGDPQRLPPIPASVVEDIQSWPLPAPPQDVPAGSTMLLPAALRGQLQMLDQQGTPLEDDALLPGLSVAVEHTTAQGETTLATTTVGPDGQFAMPEVPVPRADTYQLVVRLPCSPYTQEQAVMEVYLAPGESYNLPQRLTITDEDPPVVGVVFYNAEGGHTVLNPATAEVLVCDATRVTCRWQVLGSAGTLLHSGEGEEVNILVLGLSEGSYTLVAETTDAAGNTSQGTQAFYIYA